jgi:hypothetical protein
MIPVNQRVRWTRGRRRHTKTARHRLDEGGFSCPKLTLEGQQLTWSQSPAQPLSAGIQLIQRE